jgi:transcription elongation factor GreA
VGLTEADPKRLYVSSESPIGEALLGKRVGDEVSVNTPGGELKLRIMEIRKR